MSQLHDSVLTLSIRHIGGVIVVDVGGRLTAESSGERQLVRLVRRLREEGHPWIVLNLEGVGHIDSSGLSELVEAFTTTRRKGQLKLLRTTPAVEALLRVTRLASVFEIFDVEAEAIASFVAVPKPGE